MSEIYQFNNQSMQYGIHISFSKHNFKAVEYIKEMLSLTKPISGRANRASATKAVDRGWILSWVKPKNRKTDIYSFPA